MSCRILCFSRFASGSGAAGRGVSRLRGRLRHHSVTVLVIPVLMVPILSCLYTFCLINVCFVFFYIWAGPVLEKFLFFFRKVPVKGVQMCDVFPRFLVKEKIAST